MQQAHDDSGMYIAIHLSLTKSVVAEELSERITAKSKGCCGLSCMFSYKLFVLLPLHSLLMKDKPMLASLKLYIPRLSRICWHTDLF